jgi:hypothetical protein
MVSILTPDACGQGVRTGAKEMRALKNDPVDHFSEAVRLQGRASGSAKIKSRSMTGFRPQPVY